jgi:O-glycosyl hydrolase
VPAGALTLAVQPANLQQIQGWGIHPGFAMPEGSGDVASINTAPEALRVLLEELGVNMLRLCLRPQSGSSYTATNKVLTPAYLDEMVQIIQYALTKGVDKYMISIWSPPMHMKEVYMAAAAWEDPYYRPRLKADNYDLFVSYVVDALRYLKSRGCPLPVALSLQNEPEASWLATPVDRDDCAFIEGGNLISLINKMRAALNAAGLSTVKLGAPESVSYEGAWVFKYTVLPDSYFSNVDIHLQHAYTTLSYDDNTPENVEALLTEFLRVKRQIGGESWQTEFSVSPAEGMGGSTALQRLMIAMRMFSSDMIHAGYVVWMWWNGWCPGWSIDSPDQQILISGDGVTSVQKSGLFEAFSTFFKNAPPESHVRKVTTNDPSLKTNFRIMNDLVAFQTPTGTFILLVNGADAPKTYYISGLTGTAGTRKSITGNDAKTTDSDDFTVTGGMAKVNVPRNSVNFIYTQGN